MWCWLALAAAHLSPQSNDYYAYQHELGDAGNVPKCYEYLWPEGGLTRAHYDAYIAVVAAMGVVVTPRMGARPMASASAFPNAWICISRGVGSSKRARTRSARWCGRNDVFAPN